ncbi:hypothetical protein DNTS_030567 [Danionella cerebrum]|uniref:Uncharacterized protein n=1 Tax=Danionella cerebrum TaxID=2873325 RepID=A0A553RAF0_9TELE|nr:hypothetical protein DNTS_030567 [Danionella translucida]
MLVHMSCFGGLEELFQVFRIKLDFITRMDSLSLIQTKRRLDGGLEGCHNQPKRLCNGLGGCAKAENGMVIDSPMDTWDAQNHSTHNRHGASVPGMVLPSLGQAGRGQLCLRCMAGEPGHINHIMSY